MLVLTTNFMKKLLALIALSSIVLPQAALAQHARHRPHVGTVQTTCWRDEYRETYIPGTRSNPGYVRVDVERVEYPCRRRLDTTNIRPYDPYEPEYVPTGNVDNNSCVEGAVIGGILGGAAVAAGSRGPDMAWAIPLGVVGGGLVGCQIDGG